MLNGCLNYPFECKCEACDKAHNDSDTRIQLGVFNVSIMFQSGLHPSLENALSVMAPSGIYYVIVQDVISITSQGSIRFNVRHALHHRLNISRSLKFDCYGDIDSAKRELSDVAIRIPHYGGEINIFATYDLNAQVKLQLVKQAALDLEPITWQFSKREILGNVISADHVDDNDGQQAAWLLCSLWNHVMKKGQTLYLRVPRVNDILVLDDMNSFRDLNQDAMIGHLHVKRLVKIYEI